MLLRAPYRVLAMLLVLWLGGCANATMADRPMRMAGKSADQSTPLKSYAELVKGFDRTLTGAEKKAVITALQKDRERQQEAAATRDTGGG
jgi:hypothetical protein